MPISYFPLADPIPLPAPVWFFKLLHTVTLTLHFFAVHLLIAGLILGIAWALNARFRGRSVSMESAGLITNRLPMVMAFVINLAIPPLLFTQVLYGNALFSSSIMIGLFWISVIFLVIILYYFLYISQQRLNKGKSWWWLNLIALVLVFKVALIYVNNMTLMLRPEAWPEMYKNSPIGAQLASGDPTIIPRWLFMIFASLALGGTGILILSMKKSITDEVRKYLRLWGCAITAVFAMAIIPLGMLVINNQPDTVRQAIKEMDVYSQFLNIWKASAALLVMAAIMTAAQAYNARKIFPVLAFAAAFINILSWVVVRDGIRDITLYEKGLDVWNRTIATNWSVVIFFLVLFLVAIGALIWMTRLIFTMKEKKESYA
ncbi:MAG: hypothetical protein JW737_01695 [Acidobacteria bacterium]|nr:hypothetical protein [Acidobacteriota bacterium]